MKPSVVFKQRLDAKLDKQAYWTGVVGDGNAVIDVPDRAGYVYVRIDGQSVAEEVYNDAVPVANNLPVILGRDPTQPNVKRILRARFVPGVASATLPATQYSANRFRWMATGGGQDPLFVELRQYMPLRPAPKTGMTLEVARGLVQTSTGFALADTATIDLTAHIPATAGKAAWVLITIDDSASLVGTKGSEVNVAALALTDMPAVPTGTTFVVCAVRVYNGQTAIQEARSNTDLVDLRWSWYGTNEDISLALDDLSDVTITTPASGQVLTYDGSGWVNDDAAAGGVKPSKILLITPGTDTVEYAFTATGLTNALGAAAAGDSVQLPNGEVVGNFAIPESVTVQGQGADSTLINGTLTLGAGGAQVLRGLTAYIFSNTAPLIIALDAATNSVSDYIAEGCSFRGWTNNAPSQAAAVLNPADGGGTFKNCYLGASNFGTNGYPVIESDGVGGYVNSQSLMNGCWTDVPPLGTWGPVSYYGTDAQFDVDEFGYAHASDIDAGALKYHVEWVDVPASSTAAGSKGQIAVDANYVYLAYGTDQWIRIQKDTW